MGKLCIPQKGKAQVIQRAHSSRIQQIHRAVWNQLKESQVKTKLRHDKHQVDHHFQVGKQVWLYISKVRLKGEDTKLKLIRYGPFKIVEKIGNNAL